MSLIEKIDAEIAWLNERLDTARIEHDKLGIWKTKGMIYEVEKMKQIILSEQKEPCYSKRDCEMKENGKCYLDGPCPHLIKPLTIGDKIRESNESLAEEIKKFGHKCNDCICYEDMEKCNETSCIDGILAYLNQPYTE